MAVSGPFAGAPKREASAAAVFGAPGGIVVSGASRVVLTGDGMVSEVSTVARSPVKHAESMEMLTVRMPRAARRDRAEVRTGSERTGAGTLDSRDPS